MVLTGNGRAFSAGQDLGEWSNIDPSAASAPDDPGPGFPRFIDTVAAFEKPLIAAVNGLGVGIGLTVLLHCDLVLIARGANVNARAASDFTPLHESAASGRMEFTKLLLENGADVNARTSDGKTPLDYAREHNRAEMVQLLSKYVRGE